MKKMFEKDNLVFGVIWGILVIFLAGFLIKAIGIIQLVTDTLLEWGLKAFVFPSLIADLLNTSNTMKYVIILAITILTAPFARKAFEWVMNVFKKSPV